MRASFANHTALNHTKNKSIAINLGLYNSPLAVPQHSLNKFDRELRSHSTFTLWIVLLVFMQILFADSFPARQLQQLQDLGHSIDFQPNLSAEDLSGVIQGKDVIIVRSTKVQSDTIAAADHLKMILRAGAGTNTIDKACAAEHGIAVCNVPGKNAVAVAELTLGLLLSIDRNIPDNVQALRNHQWDKKRFSTAQGLAGRSIGIIGVGAIGLAVAQRARAFELEVVMVDKPGRSDAMQEKIAELDVRLVPDLETLASECDIVSIHVPGSESTKNLIGAEFLSRMREGSVLLNTSRGDVVDSAALIKALDEQSMRAGLDVYADEPATGSCDYHSELATHPRVYGTHHIGASTEQAQNAVADSVIEIINALERGTVVNQVN